MLISPLVRRVMKGTMCCHYIKFLAQDHGDSVAELHLLFLKCTTIETLLDRFDLFKLFTSVTTLKLYAYSKPQFIIALSHVEVVSEDYSS
jgi:hypothetical protein